MNPAQKKLLLSTLKREESTSTFEIFPSTSTWKYFQVLVLWKMMFRSTLKYATSDFTGISKSTSIKRLAFFKAFGLGSAGKVFINNSYTKNKENQLRGGCLEIEGRNFINQAKSLFSFF